MLVGFYLDEFNFRGVSNSTFDYAHYNEKILKNKSIIFYNKKNFRNIKSVKKKFEKRFLILGVNEFKDIDEFKNKYEFDYIYTQKGGKKDNWKLKNFKLLVHSLYPQALSEIHGHRYVCVSEWLEKEFTNYKIKSVPYIVELDKTKKNLKKELKITKDKIIFGCHGGSSSFDIKFVKDTIVKIAQERKDIVFLFLNIDKFANHPRIIFLKGTADPIRKRKFLNTCDSMIYARSLGESFGLACAEFFLLGKKVISYKYNRHRNHIFKSNRNNCIEYGSNFDLYKILINFKKSKKTSTKKFKEIYSSQKVMAKFDKIFFKSQPVNINFYDKIINLIGLLKVSYYYFRHKFYIHYYKIFSCNF